jgi:ubiquitin carboxyl-terminal hydrolase 2/21
MSQSSEDSKKEMRGVLGLANLGNTCYMNAVIQAWRNCPEWTLFCKNNTVDEHVKDKESNHAKFLFAYKELLQSLWAGTGPAYVKPLGFYDHLRHIVKGTIYEDFVRRTPQDAHEYLVWMLDQMYMATQKEVEIRINNEAALPPMVLSAVKGWKSAFEKQYSPLTDLIFGLYRIQYVCHGCKATHTRWETFNVLKVSLARGPAGITLPLKQCVEKELEPEEIEGYMCDACKQRCNTTKTTCIWRLPKVLIVTLKRFTPMGTKDGAPLNYDGEPLSLGSLFADESGEETRNKNYKCFATVDHHGNHMGGHYTAQAMSPVWHKWHLYDDESAHMLEKPKYGHSTYILMFR